MVLGCLLHQSPLEREESPAAEQGVERRPGGRAQARLQEASGGGLRGVRRGVALRGGRKLDRRLPTHRRALVGERMWPFSPSSLQFSSVAQLCLTLCDPMGCITPGLPVHHQLPELAQTHVHGVRDTIQPSHPRSSPSPPASNLSQHQGLFKGVSSSHQVAKVLEFQLQHQSFQ